MPPIDGKFQSLSEVDILYEYIQVLGTRNCDN
jgi:hypothetical protein